MQRVAATVPTHRARRAGKPLQSVENPGPTLGASPSTRLSTLAPATALSLPSLTGVPPSYEYYDGDERLFAFLHRLAELGIASTAPAEIEKLRTSPLAYAEASLASWVNAQGGDTIDGNINYSLAIQTVAEEMLANKTMKDSLLITAEAAYCGYMVAGAALDALEAKAKGLGEAFYRVLYTSLVRWMRIYDYSDARYYVDEMKQMAEGDNESDQYEFPDVEAAIPRFSATLPLRAQFTNTTSHCCESTRKAARSVAGSAGSSRFTGWPSFRPQAMFANSSALTTTRRACPHC